MDFVSSVIIKDKTFIVNGSVVVGMELKDALVQIYRMVLARDESLDRHLKQMLN